MEIIERYLREAGGTRITTSGDNLICCCPFHEERHRSFSINSLTGHYICFSASCGVQGNLLTFLTQGVGYSKERATRLAQEYGTVVARFTDGKWDELPDWGERHEPERTKSPVTEPQLGMYEFCPRYMLRRGFDKAVLRRWEVGYDRETKHVTFPVRDARGNLVGISKRATEDVNEMKYLHLGFSKSRFIYGAHLVPKDHRAVWVGEGQPDALALEQMGLPEGHHAVSTMGARVSPTQIAILARYRQVILALDNDDDGWRAAEKIGEGLLELGKCAKIARSYPPRIKDPSDLLQKRPGRVKRFLRRLEDWDTVRLL